MPSLPRLSQRLPVELSLSPLHAALEAVGGAAPVDLMQSNPTCCAFRYPHLALPLLGPSTWSYCPDAFGHKASRAALATYLCDRGAQITAADLLLTASTSEAYSTLFKLLCNPGEAVAIGMPCYPLVAHLAALDAVKTVSYRWTLTAAGRWELDMDSVAQALAVPKVRAFILIEPSSPLGGRLPWRVYTAVAAACSQAGVVLIVDAVFAPYSRLDGELQVDQTFARLPPICCAQGVTVVLSGLSKAAGLPQLKLGWMSLHGDPAWVTHLRTGLEWIADAYLSVSTPVQLALPQILGSMDTIQQQIRWRLKVNRAVLTEVLEPLSDITLLPADGGWYAILRGPEGVDEDPIVCTLRQQAQCLVHPGYFYDFEQTGLWVLGLLLPTDVFAPAVRRLALVLQDQQWS